MLDIYSYDIKFQEVPDEICLNFYCHGCLLNCKNCFWDKTIEHKQVGFKEYESILLKYNNKATTVVFLGGEWDRSLYVYLDLAHHYKYKTCLYTGLYKEELERLEYGQLILDNLDYVKYGRYIESLGNLYTETTNQQLIRLADNKIILGKDKQ